MNMYKYEKTHGLRRMILFTAKVFAYVQCFGFFDKTIIWAFEYLVLYLLNFT